MCIANKHTVWHTVRVFVFLSKLNYVQFVGEQITIRYRLMVRIHQSFDFSFRKQKWNREREKRATISSLVLYNLWSKQTPMNTHGCSKYIFKIGYVLGLSCCVKAFSVWNYSFYILWSMQQALPAKCSSLYSNHSNVFRWSF